MNIVSIGGGPAGLYFSILMKKAFPDSRVRVIERNRPDDTFGWGVVFSAETLGHFEDADPESYREIIASFRYWDDIETHYGGTMVTSTGHGFCGFARRRLLEILQKRADELGVELEFEREVSGPEEFPDADLILAADGVNSAVREQLAEHVEPHIDWRRCKFTWLGTTLPLQAFTFIFKENEHGLFQVHAYPFEDGLSTFIVECHEDVWRKAGLDEASEEDTVRYCEELFAEYLDGHRLLTNRSIWRTFPTITCGKWHHGNVVLVGDAVHTAHFSIGSGTKLAMEDAIALVDAFKEHGTDDVERVLEAYEEARRIDVIKLQKAAQTSLEWFEHSARYMGQDPIPFSFNLMTRSKRITWDNLAARDPELVRQTAAWFADDVGAPRRADGSAPEPIFTPLRLGGVDLVNRIGVSPMCQYSCTNGVPGDWHLVHLGGMALGGAGLVIAEMTNVEPEGRITLGCAGLWSDAHRDAWKRVVDFVHAQSPAKIGIQIAHAGRKASATLPWDGPERALREDEGGWRTLAPSPLAWAEGWPVPKEMDGDDRARLTEKFAQAAVRADEAGFDLVEIHMAHGYLLGEWLSPLVNQRTDDYGGSLENRLRWPLEVLDAVRAVWPQEKALSVRISASDWVPGGVDAREAVDIARALVAHGADVIDVSSGGTVPDAEIGYGRMFQVPFAERIRYETGAKVMAVGAILGHDHANTILGAGRADLALMARPHLRDPALTRHAAEAYGHAGQWWPRQYRAAKPK